MKTTGQAIHASTQKFTEIVDIINNVVFLEGGNACMVIEVTASNFALLSKKEQDAKIYSYAALLNSLTFPIQILIRNKRIDITSYLKDLEDQERQTQNELLAAHIKQYREFIHQMVKINVVLNKTFYIVISFSSLEAGVTGAVPKKGTQRQVYIDFAAKTLQSKSETLLVQLRRLALAAKMLEKEELVKLFYDIYNQDLLETAQLTTEMKTALVKSSI